MELRKHQCQMFQIVIHRASTKGRNLVSITVRRSFWSCFIRVHIVQTPVRLYKLDRERFFDALEKVLMKKAKFCSEKCLTLQGFSDQTITTYKIVHGINGTTAD